MEIFSAIASAVVTTGIQSFFGSSRNTPRVSRLQPQRAPSNLRVPSIEAGDPPVAAQAGSTTAIATLINRHEAIMDSIDVSKGVSFGSETTRIA